MKKILGILSLSFFLSVNAQASLNGHGELKLSDRVVNALIHYLNPDATHNKLEGHDSKGNPLYFAVSISGNQLGYTYCPRGQNCRRDAARVTQHCKKKAGEKCYIFASGRKIVWDGINYRFKRKSTELEIRSKLEEWGFTGDNQSSNKIEKKKTVTTTTTNDSVDIVTKLEGLKKMLESGLITKEEFEKAKKKLLN